MPSLILCSSLIVTQTQPAQTQVRLAGGDEEDEEHWRAEEATV